MVDFPPELFILETRLLISQIAVT